MEIYTEVITLKISKVQKQTLSKLRSRNIKVSNFIRQAIKEKLERDASELIDKSKIKYCPFSNGTIILK
jgi:post-segregation antitoxin (ccd killing protein)